jgi:hypothetical protein
MITGLNQCIAALSTGIVMGNTKNRDQGTGIRNGVSEAGGVRVLRELQC